MKKIILTIPLVLTLTSCGLIFTGTTDTITVTSNPSGAEVFVNNEKVGNAPLIYELSKSKNDKMLRVKLNNQEEVRRLKSTFNTISILNLIGIIEWTIDIVSGGMWTYEPDSVHVEFEDKQ